MSSIEKNNFSNAKISPKTLPNGLSFGASEQYKLLRTNLEFTLPAEEKHHIIGVTSSMRGDGKSTTSINLAFALAEKKKPVLLIEGDLRLPSIAAKLGIKGSYGLSDFLMQEDINSMSLGDFKSELHPNLFVLPSGTLPPNPSELLGSKRMEIVLNSFRQLFDYIIVDLPPVNIVSDALEISKFLTGVIVVVRQDYTEKSQLDFCIRQLELSNVKILGCIMNDISSSNNKSIK